MKTTKKEMSSPFTGPLLATLREQDQANFKANLSSPSIGEVPLPAPDLYQDSGSGYNADFTFPQD